MLPVFSSVKGFQMKCECINRFQIKPNKVDRYEYIYDA